MKLIVGLGNPEEKYNDTRHNVGFSAADLLMKNFSSVNFQFSNQLTGNSFEENKKLNSFVFVPDDLGIVLAKPTTYMNESGSAVSKLVKHFRVNPPNLWIIHDDLDIPLGNYKIQKGKGPKDHNGLNSIYESLGTKDFWHVRLGVDNRDSETKRIPGEKYVLLKLSNPEISVRDEVVSKAAQELQAMLKA